ncbi:hypothetical protein AALP_AA7G124000 [Arabis alpina]|uniref:Zinc knuckle CX2CX4HX4C domain-containing protein n=1 Tax=Arabis alpina TaxID=50452 RepID=A0A087GHK7_ARAAL|nr:hypothetical protein AALP_AA7G124000 [Arabis alpina]
MHIARGLGMFLETDYIPEVAARVEFVRVRLDWDVDQPLRFQRNFQFTLGHNTLLRIRCERLRGFCEVCGMLTHDSGSCLIQNGGHEHLSDGDDDNEDDGVPEIVPHHNEGVQIREIDEDVEEAEGDVGNVPDEMVPTDEHDLFEEGNGFGSHPEFEMSEIFNPCPTIPNSTGDIPYDGLSAEVHDLQTLYAAFNDPFVHDYNITGKRKILDDDEDLKPRK